MRNEKTKRARKSTRQATKPAPGLTVVGIGASAGGLSALKKLFEHVPPDTGLAFVVVVHLSPEHKSFLSDLLQPAARVPIRQVTGDTLLEANNVYVIPPNANLSAIDSHLRLSSLEEARRRRAPIDHFFRTLAKVHDGHSIGVILTGTGSDGTLGLREIKARGGLILVQDPHEAEFDGMPQSAIATGQVDRVLPLAEIPEALLRYTKTDPRINVSEEGKDDKPHEVVLLPKILAILKARTERDFSWYKPATILRRIVRRMQLNYIEDANVYIERLRENPDEARALADDLLITVTSFFRDPDVFRKLEEEVIPKLFEGKGPKDQVRIWSVGCATGEEAYSLAILLIEAAERREGPPHIQVFASDLHKRSLDSAREGVFPGDIETDVSAERLKRFFQKENGGYRIRKEVRDLVVFAPHNLLSDPPFSRLHLISCRNVLIYLERDVQQDVIDLFHYSLSSDGFLLLGSSETVESAELFRTEDKKTCLFRKRNVPPPEPRLPVFPLMRTIVPGEIVGQAEYKPNSIPYGRLHQNMLERYAPPSILVGPDDRLVHLSEQGGKYLVHPGGAVTSSAVKLVREELRIELRALLGQARERRKAIDSRAIPVRFNGHSTPVVMQVRPSRDAEQDGYVLVFFQEQTELKLENLGARSSAALGTKKDGERITQLEAELNVAHQRLQAIIEEHETSREEMKASNEEMQSSNEELRSTMEELETSKEELQSINEELLTVNQENRHKVEELSQLSSDLQNLLAATEIATLFLDRDLRILRFTPRVAEVFNVRVTDRGRPIFDLTHRLGYEHLRSDAETVLQRLVPLEREIEDNAGNWYLTRILPYRSTEDRIEGIVLTFIDISIQKKAENTVRAAARELFAEGAWLRTLLDSLSDGIIAVDGKGRITYINSAAERLSGWQASDAIGKPIRDVYNTRTMTGEPLEQAQVQRALSLPFVIGKERSQLRTRDGRVLAVEDSAAPIVAGKKVDGAVMIFAEITEKLRQERLIEEQRDRLKGEVNRASHELGQTQSELRALSAYLINTQEEERQRLARELHDDFGQGIALLSMHARKALEEFQTNPAESERLLESIRRETSTLGEGIREVSHRLHPSVLEDLGLLAAIRSLVEGLRNHEEKISLRLPDEIPPITVDAATAMYRVAQEALRNAMKHAPEALIQVSLTVANNAVQLMVRDDGQGFEIERIRRGVGLGILSMNERARLVNGALILNSEPGSGTLVAIRVPVMSPDDEDNVPANNDFGASNG